MCYDGRGPNRVQYALKENEKGHGGLLGEQMGARRSVELKQSLKGVQNQTLKGVCEGREIRGLATIGEAPDSVRGPTMSQYPSRANITVMEDACRHGLARERQLW